MRVIFETLPHTRVSSLTLDRNDLHTRDAKGDPWRHLSERLQYLSMAQCNVCASVSEIADAISRHQ